MPRLPDGTYVLPPRNPVVPGTVIDTAWANPTMEDFAVQFNNVLTRDGSLGYTVSAKFISGNVGAPGYHFGTDTASGMYAGAGFIGMSYAGVERWRVSATGTTFNGAVSATGNIKVLNPGCSYQGFVSARYFNNSSYVGGITWGYLEFQDSAGAVMSGLYCSRIGTGAGSPAAIYYKGIEIGNAGIPYADTNVQYTEAHNGKVLRLGSTNQIVSAQASGFAVTLVFLNPLTITNSGMDMYVAGVGQCQTISVGQYSVVSILYTVGAEVWVTIAGSFTTT